MPSAIHPAAGRLTWPAHRPCRTDAPQALATLRKARRGPLLQGVDRSASVGSDRQRPSSVAHDVGQRRKQTLKLGHGVVVHHRHAHDTVVMVFPESFDQTARVEIPEPDCDLVGVHPTRDRARVHTLEPEGDRRNAQVAVIASLPDHPAVVARVQPFQQPVGEDLLLTRDGCEPRLDLPDATELANRTLASRTARGHTPRQSIR